MSLNTVHGKGGMLYMSPGTGAAVKVLNARGWKLTIDKADDEDNALGDVWESRLIGLLRFQGSIQGNLDTAQTTAWDSAIATTASNFYFYPVATAVARYYYGQAHFKLDVDLSLANTVRYTADFVGVGQVAAN